MRCPLKEETVQTADVFSALFLSYILFFANYAVITVSFSFEIRWRVKEICSLRSKLSDDSLGSRL